MGGGDSGGGCAEIEGEGVSMCCRARGQGRNFPGSGDSTNGQAFDGIESSWRVGGSCRAVA